MNFCIYGNPTIDIIEYSDGSTTIAYGGGVYYSSLPLLTRGFNIEVYAVRNPLIINHPVYKYITGSQYSTDVNIFLLKYSNHERKLQLYRRAPPIHESNTHNGLCSVIVNPVAGEITPNLLKTLRVKSSILALDIQGFIREVVNNEVLLKPKPEAYIAIQQADIIHMDLNELQVLVNTSNPVQGASSLTKYTRGIIVVTNRPNRFIIGFNGVVRELVVNEEYTTSDKTGAGDYYLASYTVHYMETLDPVESVYRAHEDTSRWLKSRSTSRSLIAPPPLSSSRVYAASR